MSNGESLTSAEILRFGKSTEMVENRSVTPDYRKALGTPLLRGRDFDVRDINSKSPVVMVNEKFAQTYFRGRDPIGGRLRIGIGDLLNAPWATVVAVVGDIRHNSLEQASQPQIFQPADSGENFAIQCDVPVEQIISKARAALRWLDRTLSFEDIHTMQQRIQESNAGRRFQTMLLTAFAAMAIILALIGLYGLMSYSVKQRTVEIGIRLAIGSTRSRVLSLLVLQGLRLTAVGLLIGSVCAFALNRLLASWLFEVKASDPVTFIIVPLFILAVAFCACVMPAWTATWIDPVRSLRQE